jgi:hypothetical protein
MPAGDKSSGTFDRKPFSDLWIDPVSVWFFHLKIHYRQAVHVAQAARAGL